MQHMENQHVLLILTSAACGYQTGLLKKKKKKMFYLSGFIGSPYMNNEHKMKSATQIKSNTL